VVKAKKVEAGAGLEVGRPVMVCGAFQGRVVFFGRLSGELEPDARGGVTLRAAQNLLNWSGVRGLGECATTGPSRQCKVGPPVLRLWVADVTAIVECSEAAAKAWEAQPWS
jgi:hypothetical protein